MQTKTCTLLKFTNTKNHCEETISDCTYALQMWSSSPSTENLLLKIRMNAHLAISHFTEVCKDFQVIVKQQQTLLLPFIQTFKGVRKEYGYKTAKKAVIILHGYGASCEDLYEVCTSVFGVEIPDYRLVFPNVLVLTSIVTHRGCIQLDFQ